MVLTRRDFLKAASAVATALGLGPLGSRHLREALGAAAQDAGVPVIWLQGQSCSGCSVSLMNSITLGTIADLLTQTLDVRYHPTLMAASGQTARAAAEQAFEDGGYVLVLEGAIPLGEAGNFCTVWDGLTVMDALRRYSRRAGFIMGVGTCACFGGIPAAQPNPTRSRGLGARFAGQRVINVPGCPVHPDWVVGTIAHIIATGQPPTLDRYGRPYPYFQRKLHDHCPRKPMEEVDRIGEVGCMQEIGCRGERTRADCYLRKWNAGGAGQDGVNWCIGAGTPCQGCTEPSFPDGMSPFYKLEEHDD